MNQSSYASEVKLAQHFLRHFQPGARPMIRRVFETGLYFKSSPSGLLEHARLSAAAALADPRNNSQLAAWKQLLLQCQHNAPCVKAYAHQLLCESEPC